MRIDTKPFGPGLVITGFGAYPTPLENVNLIRIPEHIETAQEIAEKSVTLVENSLDLVPLDSGSTGEVLVISPDNLLLDDGQLSLSEYFADAGYSVQQQVISHTVTETQKQEALAKAEESDLVIFATHNFAYNPTYYGNTQIELGEALHEFSSDTGIPVILVSVENPYDLRKLPDFPTEIVTYTSSTTSIQALVDAMTGKIEFQGVLPVELD